MDLSIIVPLYNAESYVEGCINSLLNQDIDKKLYEIIIINDGSTDSSYAIVERLSKSYKNITLFNQHNQGPGATRNTGIALAKGEYIYFIDSDDYIAHNTLGTLIDCLKKNSLELIGFDSIYFTEDLNLYTSRTNGLIPDSEVLKGADFIKKHKNFELGPCWYIIRREFLLQTKHKFAEGRFHEDAMFTIRVIIDAKRLMFMKFDVHRYVKNPSSIMNRQSSNHIKKFVDDWIKLISQFSNLTAEILNTDWKDRFVLADIIRYRQALNLHYLLIRLIGMDISIKKVNNLLKKFKDMKIYPLEFTKEQSKGSDLPFKLSVLLFNCRLLYFMILFPARYLNKKV